jgi:hypothetical protein
MRKKGLPLAGVMHNGAFLDKRTSAERLSEAINEALAKYREKKQ